MPGLPRRISLQQLIADNLRHTGLVVRAHGGIGKAQDGHRIEQPLIPEGKRRAVKLAKRKSERKARRVNR
jgi:hypothetical protein